MGKILVDPRSLLKFIVYRIDEDSLKSKFIVQPAANVPRSCSDIQADKDHL